jgi:ligand-binding sensor domain-containing protein
MFNNVTKVETMKKATISAAFALFIAASVLLLPSCQKKQESCWECFSKPKDQCKGMGKCKWEPKITIDQVWSSSNCASYQVNDNGRCMCEQDNIAAVEKASRSVSSFPFYSFNNVSCIGTDMNNNVWVSHDNTTEYFSGASWTTNDLRPSENISNHTPPYTQTVQAANSFYASSNNTLFASTAEYGLASVSAATPSNPWSYYQTNNSGICTQNLNSVYAESDSRVWLGTKDKGIMKFDLPNTWTCYNSTNTSMHSNNITAMTADHSGNIWFADDMGFGSLVASTVTEFMIGAVRGIACDGEGNIWAATNDGLKRWNPSTHVMDYFGTETSGLNTSTVLSVTTDRNGKLWIGTDAGLYTYEGGKIVKITPANDYQVGLVIKALSVDLNNKLWIATDKGVAMMAQ